MAKLAKTTKKITTPKVEAVETPTEETEEVVPTVQNQPKADVKPISLNEAFMAQVDRALENAFKLYERKSLSRQEIQSIANSVLR